MQLMRIYRHSSPALKRQVWWTAGAICTMAGVQVFAQTPQAPTTVEVWFTAPNLMAAATLIYHIGAIRQQFADVKRRLEIVEARLFGGSAPSGPIIKP